MKKFVPLLTVLLLISLPRVATAETTSLPPFKTAKSEATALLARLDVISAMDKSSMSSTEKKELRKEVSSIEKRLKKLGGGVYISVGTLVIIIILQIILL